MCGDKMLTWPTFLRGMRFTRYTVASSDSKNGLPESFYNWCILLDLWANYLRANKWSNLLKWHHSRNLRTVLRDPESLKHRYCHHKLICWVVYGAAMPLLLLFVAIFHVFLDVPLLVLSVLGLLLSNFPLPNMFVRWKPTGPVGEFYGFKRIGESLRSTKVPPEVLVGVIGALRGRVATEQRYRAYAFYGVLNGLGAELPQPDYTRETGYIFHQFFSGLIHWDGAFILLLMDSGTGRTQRLHDTPTWVPVFHDCASSWLDPTYYSGENVHSATPKADLLFNFFPGRATSGEQDVRNTTSSEYGNELTMSVQWHGTVRLLFGLLGTTTPHPPENANISPRILPELLPKVLLWFSHLREKVPATQAYTSISNAIFRVLQARDSLPVEDEGDSFNKWYSILIQLAGTTSTKEDCNDEVVVDNAFSTLTTDPDACDYFIQCCTKLVKERRNLFITSCGYIGSGPDTMLEGDKIALVRGIPVPMLLRDAEDGSGRYTVVGPAFVHGLMRGEDWGKQKEQNVVLI